MNGLYKIVYVNVNNDYDNNSKNNNNVNDKHRSCVLSTGMWSVYNLIKITIQKYKTASRILKLRNLQILHTPNMVYLQYNH